MPIKWPDKSFKENIFFCVNGNWIGPQIISPKSVSTLDKYQLKLLVENSVSAI